MRERELYVSSYLSARECLTIVHLSAYIDDEALQRGEGTYLDGAGDKIGVLSDITDLFDSHGGRLGCLRGWQSGKINKYIISSGIRHDNDEDTDVRTKVPDTY